MYDEYIKISVDDREGMEAEAERIRIEQAIQEADRKTYIESLNNEVIQ